MKYIPSDYTFKEHSVKEIKNTNLSRAGNALYGMFGWSVQNKIFNPDEKIVIWSRTSGKKGNWHLPNLKVNQTILEKLTISIHFRNTDT